MLSPDEILEVIRSAKLPNGYGVCCFDAPGTPAHGRLVICLLDGGVHRMFLAHDRDGSRHELAVTWDDETTVAELRASLELRACTLLQNANSHQPWIN